MKRWAIWYLSTLVVLALLAGVLANDRPLVACVDGTIEFPITHRPTGTTNWRHVLTEWAVWPPIPFRAEPLGRNEDVLLPPLSPAPDHGRHWLGTDSVGRDVAAGLLSGCRITVLVGVGGLLIALLIGLPLGAVAGYFGDSGLRLPAATPLAVVAALLLGAIYTRVSLVAALPARAGVPLGLGVTLVLVVGLRGVLLRIGPLRRRVAVPVDRVVVALLELFGSIPGLVLLLALLAYLGRPGLLAVIGIIGLLGWPSIARFLRAELLRIREMPYIRAARVGRIGEWRILFYHALPNALGPVAVTAAFLVGGSVLLEAMLSFLGIGVPADQVSWGSVLQDSRSHPKAWWLAVFPGVLLSLTVLACNSFRRR